MVVCRPCLTHLVLVAALSLAALLLCAQEESVLLVVGVGGPGEGVQQAARTRGQSSRRRVRLRLAGGAARRRGQRILREKKFMLSNL